MRVKIVVRKAGDKIIGIESTEDVDIAVCDYDPSAGDSDSVLHDIDGTECVTAFYSASAKASTALEFNTLIRDNARIIRKENGE